jgi:virginiamycin B lyase
VVSRFVTRQRRSNGACAALGVAAVVASAVLLFSVGSATSSTVARPSTALYYETTLSPASYAIDKLNLSAPKQSTQVVTVGGASLFGIALGGPYVYWSTEHGPRDRGAIMRASLSGGHVRRVVGGLTSADSVVAVDGYVYWAGQDAIGRVALNGSHLQRHLIDLPPQQGVAVADGLATDGTYLYFSSCDDNTIGRADLDGSQLEQPLISLAAKSCPQGLAVAGSHIYWTQLGSGTIGRANLDASDVDGRWLNIHSRQGPFQIVADHAHVYWTWGGVDGTPSYTGRADVNRSHLDRRFLADSLYPMALSDTESSRP